MSDTPTDRPSPASTSSAAPADDVETFNPWSVVNVVFHHLADEGLHPVLGAGDPGTPAAELLLALGVTPTVQGNRQIADDVHDRLAELRAAYESPSP